MNVLKTTLDRLEVANEQSYGGLTVFPLLGADSREPDYLTLDQAIEQGVGRVTEVSEGGSVPELSFVNEGDRPVLLVDGEELVGAKQNRTLNLTILVPAKSSVVIPFTCVERGWWSYRSDEFRSAGRSHFARARAAKASQVSESLHSRGSRHADQGQVWAAIDEKLECLGTFSPTRAMGAVYEQHQDEIGAYIDPPSTVDGQVWAVFVVSGEVSGVDLFDAPATLVALWPKLVSSYALDALSTKAQRRDLPAPPADPEAVGAFLDAVGNAEVGRFPAIGAGEDLRLRASGVAGGALWFDGRVLHLGAFRVSGSGRGTTTRRPQMASASRRRAARR